MHLLCPRVILKSIMKVHYWFKANKNGWGWKPAHWLGWLVLVGYFAALVYSFIEIDSRTHSVSDTLINFVPQALVYTGILTVITYLKGESITWGEKGEDQHKIP